MPTKYSSNFAVEVGPGPTPDVRVIHWRPSRGQRLTQAGFDALTAHASGLSGGDLSLFEVTESGHGHLTVRAGNAPAQQEAIATILRVEAHILPSARGDATGLSFNGPGQAGIWVEKGL